MTPQTIIVLLLVGLVAGILSSMVGIGGGVVIVPSLVLILGMSQKLAQGTSLAMMLPPIGVLAVMNYYKQGFVDFKVGALLCLTFVIGSYFGSKLVLGLDTALVKKIFAVFLMIVAVKYFFDK
ncbi:MAG: permease [Bacteroidetes bacterium 43-93]|nr:sulfite exporter TauE/SafE family protein [Bacteroidota bacterium]OJW96937.1 MAG: permease [Bacteroidetes bacterium 43-93]